MRASYHSIVCVSLLAVTAFGCGSRRAQDVGSAAREVVIDGNGNVATNERFVVSGGNSSNAEGRPLACATDLNQQVILNPATQGITAQFSGKLLTNCDGGGKKPVLYINAPGPFGIDPNFGCRLVAGAFNVRCQGPLLQVKSDGSVQITIEGNADFDSHRVQMRVAYE